MNFTLPAKTIASTVMLEGAGLHSGKTVHLTLKPNLASDTRRIVFVRTDLPGKPEIAVTDVDPKAPPFRTVLRNDEADVHTVEHLLSAFAGLGVTHARVELDGPEIPGMDGSAKNFVDAIRSVGAHAIPDCAVEPLIIRETVTVEDGIAHLVASPSSEKTLSIDYTLHYPGHPLAQGRFQIELNPERYIAEIAPARTFAVKPDAESMRAAGLGKGATLQNTVVIDGGHAVETTLRFPNEPVRHKILDLIGDLYVLGRPVYGKIEARCSGHKSNRELAAKLNCF
jgi:UDP-3-O-acyl N-acetylglucosamine deacetylase